MNEIDEVTQMGSKSIGRYPLCADRDLLLLPSC
jgi:hypothetical protein